MSLTLHLIRSAPADAATNMAIDAALGSAPRRLALRFYGWTEEAFSFGYGQRFRDADRRARQLGGKRAELVRRTTGGGLVDHRADLTYALGIPPDHALYRAPPSEFYRLLHTALADGLSPLGIDCKLAPPPRPESSRREPAETCFERPEPFDLILADGQKVAGAALRRNASQLLAQGSIDRQFIPPGSDESGLIESIGIAFAHFLGATEVHSSPDSSAGLTGTAPLVAQFASRAWNERR